MDDFLTIYGTTQWLAAEQIFAALLISFVLSTAIATLYRTDFTDIVSCFSFFHEVRHGFFIKFGMSLFHILTLAEMQRGFFIAFFFRQFYKLIIGDFGNFFFRFKTGGQIFFSALDFPEHSQRPRTVNFFRKRNDAEKQCHLLITFFFRLLRVNLKPQGGLCFTGISLT